MDLYTIYLSLLSRAVKSKLSVRCRQNEVIINNNKIILDLGLVLKLRRILSHLEIYKDLFFTIILIISLVILIS